jgi:hypothetical protein
MSAIDDRFANCGYDLNDTAVMLRLITQKCSKSLRIKLPLDSGLDYQLPDEWPQQPTDHGIGLIRLLGLD